MAGEFIGDVIANETVIATGIVLAGVGVAVMLKRNQAAEFEPGMVLADDDQTAPLEAEAERRPSLATVQARIAASRNGRDEAFFNDNSKNRPPKFDHSKAPRGGGQGKARNRIRYGW